MTAKTRLIMIDLETLATSANAGILSIGAVEVSDVDNQFPRKQWYCKIAVEDVSRRDYGFDISDSTMEWWKLQDPGIRLEAFSGTTPLAEALMGFAKMLESFKSPVEKTEVILLGNGATFDLSILRNAYDRLNMEVPFTGFQEHCFRTIKVMFPKIYQSAKFAVPRTGHHNALEDAKWQGKVLEEMTALLMDAHSIDLWEGSIFDA